MGFEALYTNVYRRTAYADTPSAEVQARIKMFINDIHRRILGMPGMEYLRQHQWTFSSVAATPEYTLPTYLARISGIRDTTNDVRLVGKPWDWYMSAAPNTTRISGTPEVWCPVGMTSIVTPLSDASKVYVKSTAAGDTGTAYMEGCRTGGTPFNASVVMTGLTAVQLSAHADITSISKFFVSAAAVGTITMHEDSGVGTELSNIGIGLTTARFLRIALWPTPSAVTTYLVDGLRDLSDMVQPYDEPILPRDFHWILAAGARMMEYELQDDRRYPAAKAEWEKGISDLKWYATQQADGRDGPRPVASNLGPWYPAGA